MAHIIESDQKGPFDIDDFIDTMEDEEDAKAEATPDSEEDIFAENEDPEDDEHEYRGDIPNDSFSMLWAAKSYKDHVIPFGVFVLQVSILGLISANLLQESSRPWSNFWNVPAGVPLAVTAAQYIACIVSVFTADDLIVGALHIGKRIIHKDYSPLDNQLPPISWKWEITNIMRVVEGIGVIVVSFIFIIQSSTVIDLFLNFAGVAFVGLLDDTAFLLSQSGFFGNSAKRLASRVTDFQAYAAENRGIGKKTSIARIVLFVMITVAMWAGLSIFVNRQSTLVYACRSVTISAQGETKYPWVRQMSGRYDRNETAKYNQRADYRKDQGWPFAIFYDKNDKRWAVGPHDKREEWSLMSERTSAFDITEAGEFRFWTDEASEVEVRCNDCNPNEVRSEESCSWQGECDKTTKMCVCKEGYFGDRCQHHGPCTELIMQVAFEGSRGTQNSGQHKSFDLLYQENDEPLMWLGFPVYIQKVSSRYMFFDGGRWNVIQLKSNIHSDVLEDALGKLSRHDILYISEHSNSGSPTNIVFRAMLAPEEGDDDEANFLNIGRLGETEFNVVCADCYNGEEGISLCADGSGKGTSKNGICKPVKSEVHGPVNRCNCEPGFLGPLCHTRPAEGTIKLYLDHGSGHCEVCGEANDWSLWRLDGINQTCLSFPNGPVFFNGTNGTFARHLGLNLNMTHFSVFVSSNNATSEGNLCQLEDGTKEIFAFSRNMTLENQIEINKAVHLKNIESYYGDIIDPEGIDCNTETRVDPGICDSATNLQHAWLHLDMKVTPINKYE